MGKGILQSLQICSSHPFPQMPHLLEMFYSLGAFSTVFHWVYNVTKVQKKTLGYCNMLSMNVSIMGGGGLAYKQNNVSFKICEPYHSSLFPVMP